jgi:L-cysteine/cystine lyase
MRRVTFEEARAQFPVLDRFAYLNAGSAGPLPLAATEAMAAADRHELEHGRGGKPYFDHVLELREQARARLAQLVGVPDERVALTSSTTDGCNVVLAGLELAPDDEIVTTDVEHFGLLGPLHASGRRVHIARIRDRPAGEALDAILALVTPKTRLIALSHVAWTTGHRLPIAELKAATGLPLLVDGAQSVGAILVDASGFDYYTISGQKWLCGPSPTGALYVADPDRLRVGRPSYLSQQRYDPDGSFVPRDGAARFDSGWITPAALAGLLASIDAAPAWRFERAREATDACRAALAERVEVVTEPGHATLVSFRPAGDAAETAAALFERGVVVRELPGTGWVRASCGWWTSDEDVDRLVDPL